MGFEKVKTTVERTHKYKIPYNEFWNIIKDSKQIHKSFFWSKMYPSQNSMQITLDTTEMMNYMKLLPCIGEIYSIFDKEGYVEITTTEYKEEEP